MSLFNVFLERSYEIRDSDGKSAGCGILVKKERECGIRTPPSRPWCKRTFLSLEFVDFIYARFVLRSFSDYPSDKKWLFVRYYRIFSANLDCETLNFKPVPSKMPSPLIPCCHVSFPQCSENRNTMAENPQFRGAQNRRAEFFLEQQVCSQQNDLKIAWPRNIGKLITTFNC